MLISIVIAGCRPRPKIQVPAPDTRIREEISQGDSYFSKRHLYGWRKAEEYYSHAYDTAKTEDVRQKLLLTRFLILTRQIDEDIPDPGMESAIKELCSDQLPDRFRGLCDLAQQYKAGSGATATGIRAPDKDRTRSAGFNFDGDILDVYLEEIYRRTYGLELPGEAATAQPESSSESPLFLYLDLSRKVLRNAAELEKANPEFAELLATVGEDYFQKARYINARSYYKKALDLLPDYTRALNGLGNFHFFALEDWEMAVEYYEASLKADPNGTAALFGKGASLHYIGRRAESNDLMDRVLTSDITRRGRADAKVIRYYKTEANQYKALNYWMAGDPQKAREFVDAAKQYSADSEEVNYLSGVLHFEAGQKPQARAQFQKLLRQGSSICKVNYYLGSLLNEESDPKAFDHYLAACSCMQANTTSLGKQIEAIPAMDIDPAERIALKARFEKKLFDFRLESATLIESMIRAASRSGAERYQFYQDLMADVLRRIEPSAGNTPAP